MRARVLANAFSNRDIEMLINVYEGLESIEPGSIRKLRIVGVPAKTHPKMNKRPTSCAPSKRALESPSRQV